MPTTASVRSWKHVMLTTTFTFEVIPTDEEIYYKVFDLRQDIAAQREAITRSAVEMIFENVAFKQKLEVSRRKMSNAQVLEVYKTNTKPLVNDRQEAMSQDFFNKSLYIHRNLL